MVGRPMTEGVALKTLVSSKRMGVGNGSATGKLVPKFGIADEGDERYDGERDKGVGGAEGVSSGSGLPEGEEEVTPRPVRRHANKGEVLGK